MITDSIITVLYRVFGFFIDLLPSGSSAPGWLSSSLGTIASLDPLVPVSELATFFAVYGTLLTVFYGWRVARFILSK